MRKPGFLDTTGLTHVSSQRLCSKHRAWASLDQMGSQSSEGKGTQGPIPNPESPPTGDSAQRENCFSPRGLARHTNHTSAQTHAQQYVANTKELKGIWRVFIFFCLPMVYLDLFFSLFFFLQVFCLYVVVSDFVFIGFLFVRICVSLCLYLFLRLSCFPRLFCPIPVCF